MATPARSPCENEDPCMWKGRFQSGSSKEDLADSFILEHAKHWQQFAGADRSGQILHDQGNKILRFLPCHWNAKSSSCCMVNTVL